MVSFSASGLFGVDSVFSFGGVVVGFASVLEVVGGGGVVVGTTGTVVVGTSTLAEASSDILVAYFEPDSESFSGEFVG